MDYEEIGQNIKYYRMRKHMKQAKLAEIVDSSPQHISHIECGSTKLGLPLLIRIANALSVDADILLGKNIEFQQMADLDEELYTILKYATPEQRRQCIELCRTAIKYGDWMKEF